MVAGTREPESELGPLHDASPVSNLELPMDEPGQSFKECWSAAGRHLQSQTHDAAINWLRADLNPPFLEHLSFRLGNQLFFIRIRDVHARIHSPGTLEGLRSIAKGCNGHASLMPMELKDGQWNPVTPGWGLVDASSGASVDPFSLVSDEKIEMTDWELHDFAVQTVRDYVRNKLGRQIMSSQGNPNVDPSIWFVGEDGPEWIVVRAVRYPERNAPLPANMHSTAKSCSRIGKAGHFASVAVCGSEQGLGSESAAAEPLWRGHGMQVNFEGLRRFQTPEEEQESPSTGTARVLQMHRRLLASDSVPTPVLPVSTEPASKMPPPRSIGEAPDYLLTTMGPGLLAQAEPEDDDWNRAEAEEDGIRAEARRRLKVCLQREGFLHPSRDRSTMSERERLIRDEAGRSLEEALARLANRSR